MPTDPTPTAADIDAADRWLNEGHADLRLSLALLLATVRCEGRADGLREAATVVRQSTKPRSLIGKWLVLELNNRARADHPPTPEPTPSRRAIPEQREWVPPGERDGGGS